MSRAIVIDNFSDPRWRISNLYKCVDEDGIERPFIPNSAQVKLLDDMWFQNLILKSRQHGFTTLIGILGLDQAIFNDNFATGICAHNREDAEKIFEKKIKFPYESLPDGLRTARNADTDSAKKLKFNNGSSVEVGTSLRSGTYQFVHISEFGKLCAKFPEKAKEIVTGTLETVHPGNYLFIESTAEGREGYFYRFCQDALNRQRTGAKPNKLQYKIHFFPWFEDSRNTLPADTVVITKEQQEYFAELQQKTGVTLSQEQMSWYAEKERTLGELIKQEHPSTPEEAFAASVEGTYLHTQMSLIRSRKQITRVPHIPNLPVNTAWDLGVGDMMSIFFHQRVGAENRIINYFEDHGEGLEYYVQYLQSRGYIYGDHYLPHDGAHRRLGAEGAKTVQQLLQEMGLNNVHVIPVTPSEFTAIQESRTFLPLCWFDEENCNQGIKCLDNFKKQWDDKSGAFKEKYLHDWACLPAGMKIKTTGGPKNVEDFLPGDCISLCGEEAKVVRAEYVGIKQIIELKLSSCVIIRCSEDHKFFTNKGLVMARDINPGAILLTEKEAHKWLQRKNGMLREFTESFAESNTDIGRKEKCIALRRVVNKLFYTGLCGNVETGRYLNRMLSFLLMGIGKTSRKIIGNVDLMPIMASSLSPYMTGKSLTGSCSGKYPRQDTTSLMVYSCTDMYGNTTMGKYQKGKSYTTKTTTGLTTIYRTFLASLLASTLFTMQNITNGLVVKITSLCSKMQGKSIEVTEKTVCGFEKVYDIEVEHHHAYVLADSNVVTSNSHGYKAFETLARGVTLYQGFNQTTSRPRRTRNWKTV